MVLTNNVLLQQIVESSLIDQDSKKLKSLLFQLKKIKFSSERYTVTYNRYCNYFQNTSRNRSNFKTK